ncbi:TlpA family protein disulfide reductase [Dyadobacter psychrotolerans]|nr:TlpA disulfide reductase family protein [Dyadobacter psychrotolerans]
MKKAMMFSMALLSGIALAMGQPVKQSTIDITVRFAPNQPGDTLYLSCNPYFFSFMGDLNSNLIKSVVGRDGTCHFKVPVQQPSGRFTVSKRFDLDTNLIPNGKMKTMNALINNFFWDAGDQLVVDVKKYASSGRNQISPNYDFHYSFSGRGALKNNIRFKVDSAYFHQDFVYGFFEHPFTDNFQYNDVCVNRIKAAVPVVEHYKASLDEFYYGVIKAEFFYRDAGARFRHMRYFFEKNIKGNQQARQQFLKKYEQSLAEHFSGSEDPNSVEYVNFLNQKAAFADFLVHGDSNTDRIIESLMADYRSVTKDRVVTLALEGKASANFNVLLDSALAFARDPASRMRLEKLKMRKSGIEPFPFKLPDQTGKYVKLEDFRGKFVFVDFWFTGCGGCTGYYQKVLSKIEHLFDPRDIAFVTISTDTGKALWLKSIKSGKYVSQQSVNLFTEGKGDKHPAIEHYKFNSYPSFLLIDRQGKIMAFNTEELAKRDPDNLTRVLRAAIEKK